MFSKIIAVFFVMACGPGKLQAFGNSPFDQFSQNRGVEPGQPTPVLVPQATSLLRLLGLYGNNQNSQYPSRFIQPPDDQYGSGDASSLYYVGQPSAPFGVLEPKSNSAFSSVYQPGQQNFVSPNVASNWNQFPNFPQNWQMQGGQQQGSQYQSELWARLMQQQLQLQQQQQQQQNTYLPPQYSVYPNLQKNIYPQSNYLFQQQQLPYYGSQFPFIGTGDEQKTSYGSYPFSYGSKYVTPVYVKPQQQTFSGYEILPIQRPVVDNANAYNSLCAMYAMANYEKNQMAASAAQLAMPAACLNLLNGRQQKDESVNQD